jgi:hypothetical protein
MTSPPIIVLTLIALLIGPNARDLDRGFVALIALCGTSLIADRGGK